MILPWNIQVFSCYSISTDKITDISVDLSASLKDNIPRRRNLVRLSNTVTENSIFFGFL
jgi:hypothetical protein